MRTRILKVAVALIGVALFFVLISPIGKLEAFQRGYRGTGMEQVDFKKRLDAKEAANVVPDPLPPAEGGGELAVNAYKNVQVLGHLPAAEFTRLMVAITSWVAPEQGCVYCHAPQRDEKGELVKDDDGYLVADPDKMWSDETYQKRVARRMIQMTLHINGDWKENHVHQTGVTCYTCHRGQNVPSNLWFDAVPDPSADGFAGNSAGQNHPSNASGLASLPIDPFRPYLVGDDQIRVISTAALPIDNRSSIKQAEWSYSLMMHMSQSLGVNCTYCHNSRSFGAWDTSPPARAVAWYGIRMVRDLNQHYLEPLGPTYPANRLGPTGDAPKAHCGTCHAGAYKPLLGQSMLKDYLALAEAKPQPQRTAAPPDTAPPAPGQGTSPSDKQGPGQTPPSGQQ